MIGGINKTCLPKLPFPFSGFFGQNMRGKGLAAAYFAGASERKAFGCSSVGFHLRHVSSPE